MLNIENISKNIIIRIFNDFFSFKEIIYFRLINKSFCKILEHKEIWNIINLTDINTADKKQIEGNFQNDKNSYMYLLSGKKREDCFFSIPISLKIKMINTKLLII